MKSIQLQTNINAPIHRVFDLSRSIDLHQLSTKETNEQAIAGRVSGLIELDEFVTWRAKHLGFYQTLTVKIIKFQQPYLFIDEMINGAFKSMKHEHHFEEIENGTKMIDIFTFEAPLGFLGKIAENLFLEKYMKNFLIKRNQTIKQVAESNDWKKILEKVNK